MAIPDDALDAVRRFCADRSPEDMLGHYRFEVEVDGNKVSILERRPPWDGGPGDWTKTNVAQLRFAAGKWTLYESSAERRWRQFRFRGSTPDVGPLLDEITEDPTGSFFG